MKMILCGLAGVVVGVFGLFTFQNPHIAADKVRSAADAMETEVSEVRRERCVRKFLDETGCFQKLSAKECDAQIVQRCGVPE